MTDDQIIDMALTELLIVHEQRIAKNPHGPWANDSQELVWDIQRVQRNRREAA